MKIKYSGFTLVELLSAIAIMGLLSLIIVPAVIKIIAKAEKDTMISHARSIVRTAQYEFKRLEMIGVPEFETIFTFEDGVQSSNVEGAKLEYEGDQIENGVVKIDENGRVALAIYNDKWCAIKKFSSNEIEVNEFTTQVNCQVQKLVDISGANPPKLASGMTPIIWNGSDWVEASNYDDPYEQNWYDYQNKKWANAKTADGSYWVWIPRYAYKITSCFHSNCSDGAGDIDIKFLRGKTNETTDETKIEIKDYQMGTKDTSTYYFKHPAFTFGNEEIEGFWIAKFEPSGSEDNISIKPNVSSLRSMKIGDQFDAAFNMRYKSKYGWSEAEVDTH
ncbi:MAG: type II secretion system protein, partial [Mollicutes bacterium]|nr:type II secretion system protein [Mollicutes bacterium]